MVSKLCVRVGGKGNNSKYTFFDITNVAYIDIQVLAFQKPWEAT